MLNAVESTSTRPYLVRALYEWCTDNGLTPYVAVAVDDSVQVPREYVKNDEIVLNISMDATSALKLGNDFIEFRARFGGSAREILVPMGRVVAIYARENGQGMAFPQPAPGVVVRSVTAPSLIDVTEAATPIRGVDSPTAGNTATDDSDQEPPRPPATKRPALKRVK